MRLRFFCLIALLFGSYVAQAEDGPLRYRLAAGYTKLSAPELQRLNFGTGALSANGGLSYKIAANLRLGVDFTYFETSRRTVARAMDSASVIESTFRQQRTDGVISFPINLANRLQAIPEVGIAHNNLRFRISEYSYQLHHRQDAYGLHAGGALFVHAAQEYFFELRGRRHLMRPVIDALGLDKTIRQTDVSIAFGGHF